jgi:ribonuclease HI
MELWIELDKLNTFHDVDWHWVKGHSGDSGNDMADELANQGIDNL